MHDRQTVASVVVEYVAPEQAVQVVSWVSVQFAVLILPAGQLEQGVHWVMPAAFVYVEPCTQVAQVASAEVEQGAVW